MAKRKRTVSKVIPFNQMPRGGKMKGFTFRLSLRGELLSSGTIGAIIPRGKGVTFIDQDGNKLCGLCPQTGLLRQNRASLIVSMDNGRELTIDNVFGQRRP